MKNWIISLLILTVPVVAYFALKTNKDAQNALVAEAANNRPTVIKFASPMCMDCKKIAQELNQLKPVYQDRVDFIEIDATAPDKKVQKQIDEYEVTVVPTIIFLDDENKKVKKHEGYAPKETLEQHIKELING